MADYHILFGFKEEEIIAKIVAAVRSGGNTVTYTERTSKESIIAYLERNVDCCHAVLRECMGAESFTAKDFANLTDTRDINIIALIESKHKGTNFMDTLYAAGITSGIIVSPKHGASPGKIAELILRKRTRRAARKYYGLQDSELRIDILSYGEYVLNYSKLMNPELGLNIVDRFISIVKRLSPKQVATFIQSLPPNVYQELQGYEEFWIVIENLRRSKINILATKPALVKRGLTDEQFRYALQSELKKKKGIRGPKISANIEGTLKSEETSETSLQDKNIDMDIEEEIKENYYFKEMQTGSEEKSANAGKVDNIVDEKDTDDLSEDKQTIDTKSSEGFSNLKNTYLKEQKHTKKKISWIWVVSITLLTIAVIALWLYLVFIIKI